MQVLNIEYRQETFRAFNSGSWSRLTLKSTVYIVTSHSSSDKSVSEEASVDLPYSRSSSGLSKRPAQLLNRPTAAPHRCGSSNSSSALCSRGWAKLLAPLGALLLFSLMIAVWFCSTVTIPKRQNLLWQTICSYGNSNVSNNSLRNFLTIVEWAFSSSKKF